MQPTREKPRPSPWAHTDIRRQVWQGGYIHLDATPIEQLDPDRSGSACEATLGAYRARDGPIWFKYAKSKTPDGPTTRLANLFTLIENRRLVGADPATYLIDLIARLPDHPNMRIAGAYQLGARASSRRS